MASPELAGIIETLRANPLVGGSIEDMRKNMDEFSGPPVQGVDYAPVQASGVPCEWATAPGAAVDRALLYLHGGGYVLGSVKSHRGLVGRLSQAGGLRVLSVDYRLAPEHPFPAAVDDACAAYRFLLQQGLAPSKLAIAGDSAGGGLAVATLLALRDAGDPLPALGVCISPWVDMEAAGASMQTKAKEDPMVGKEAISGMAQAYLGGADPKTPLASPIHADLSGLPPLLIQVGTAETLLDDSTRLTERARAAGVQVELEPWEEMIHVWHAFAPALPEANQAIERIGAELQKRLG